MVLGAQGVERLVEEIIEARKWLKSYEKSLGHRKGKLDAAKKGSKTEESARRAVEQWEDKVRRQREYLDELEKKARKSWVEPVAEPKLTG